ncbi:NAD(P)H-quinone oxidoreductase [Lacimicrobium alkaliphilum]|uniref:Zinc-binding alcohol dehydrogenase n=1 Tax=Lacimicrobium alkaliphilum TaxID=1526571 RepID=A0A0U2RMD4_9ALTE|nr:NAD(P)H-quinone oxidoreductase [Lacimicrobium alkaliphilum]ALS98426.1 zinc-binding alcohol dehydrogenase [Lacimicrobium alkaliphilum]
MRYIRHHEDGAMNIDQMPVPALQSGQVLVRVTSFGINRADLLQRQGKYPPPAGESEILGLEVAGEVADAGDCGNWQQGDRVCGLVAGGGYAEYVAVNAEHLMRVPDTLELMDAGGLAEVFLTAYQALFLLGNLQGGESVLIHAGASGVGSAAVQLARFKGARVAVTASSEQKLGFCQQLGAQLLINYQQQDFAKQIKEQWQGVDLVIDIVAGDYVNANIRALNLDGRIIQLAMLAGRYVEKLDMARMLQKRASLRASTLRNRSDGYKTDLVKAFSHDCLSAFATNELKVCVDQHYRADDIAAAHDQLQANHNCGKLIGYWD